MLDLNHRPTLQERLSSLLDSSLQAAQAREPRRTYLGASRLGVACERALQYEYAGAPVDAGREYSGPLLRIFRRGHVIEDCMAEWLRAAGFDLLTRDRQDQPFGFSALDGRLQGHVDGVLVGGPDLLAYPCVWENKCLNAKSWRELDKHGLAAAKPIYAAQIALYQAYLRLHDQPALFTAVNADSMAIYAEAVPFDGGLAQRMSDRAVKIVTATAAGDLLPRSFADASHIECRLCAWQERCWQGAARC